MRIPVLIALLSSTSGVDESQLIATWAVNPFEARASFRRPIAPEVATALEGATWQLAGGGTLRIAAARLLDDGKTLIMIVDPFPRSDRYELKLPGLPPAPSLRLIGVLASFQSEGEDQPTWNGWLPDLDAKACFERLAGSPDHDRGAAAIGVAPGVLRLETAIRGPIGPLGLDLTADVPFAATLGFEEEMTSTPDGEGRHRAHLQTTADAEPTPLVVTATTSRRLPILAATLPAAASWHLPWAPTDPANAPEPPPPPYALENGDRSRGERVFRAMASKCADCHQVAGIGGTIGPTLDVPRRRDPAWIYQQIAEPSTDILPEYRTHTLVLDDGSVLVGVVRARSFDEIEVRDHDAKSIPIRRSTIVEIRSGGSSIMPQGLAATIGEADMRDLIAYLMKAD